MAHPRKIDLMIIGAQKAATSSMKEYLAEHPQIQMHYRQEFAYFFSPLEQERGFDPVFKEYYGTIRPGIKIIAAKHAGMHEKEEYIRLLHEHNPDCILIFALRNPVDRAYSGYQMEVARGLIDYPFEQLKEDIENYKKGNKSKTFRLFFDLGMYATQLRFIYKYFPPEQVMIFTQEEIASDTPGLIKKIFQRCGVDDQFVPDYKTVHNATYTSKSKALGRIFRRITKPSHPFNKFIRKLVPHRLLTILGDRFKTWNQSEVKFPPMSPEMRNYLIDFYYGEMKGLEELLHRDFSAWYTKS